ncbi:MAG: tRNA modification GTPase MnmE [Lysobacteraceae bacterium]|nr:MAG: tRNA modification GTPase MnmE [Xanthomonadaceae bacterium]
MSRGDTIAAIATGRVPAGVGIVRISGPEAPAIAATLLGRRPRPRHAHLLRLVDAEGGLIDQGLLLAFPAPHSFTGEDVVELQLHGSPVVLDLALARVCALGARHARPGEFTERAFLNGKIDLAQAEAVADLIAAGSEAQARAAARSLQGVFSRKVEALVEGLTRLRVHVEAAIDFPEEEIDHLADPVLRQALDGLDAELAALLAESRRGARLNRGQQVLILGPPNAGKSSLLNLLAGCERAIVTPTPGTTRDLLHQDIHLDGLTLTLVDTAGLRAESTDAIELEGMRRARAQRDLADLLLLVIPDGDETALAELLAELDPGRPVLVVHNKIDLSGGRAGLRHREGKRWHLGLCARSGDGLDALRQALAEQLLGGAEPAAFTARERHVQALQRAGDCLQRASSLLAAGQGELLAEELRHAQTALGEITGAVDADTLLGRIFSAFCIGK